MKKYYQITCLTLFALFVFSACKYSKEYKLVNVAGKFSMMVPPWVKEDKELKPGAEFQYANHFRNFYSIGTAEEKDSAKSISSIMATNLNVLRGAMTKPVVTDSVNVTVGGLNGVRVEIYGNMNGEAIYFSEEVIEGKNRFYHLSVWTRTADRKLKFKGDIDQMLNSFKEL